MLNLKPSNLAVGGHGVHYAWVMVGIAAIMRLASSAFRTSSSVLIPRIVETFGWSYGVVGSVFALQWVVSGLFGPPAGWASDRYGARKVMAVGAVLFIIGMVFTGLMTSLWQFYFFFGIVLSASMAIFQVPLTTTVTMWFKKRLGLGMGLLQSSQGVGPLVAVPIVLFLLHRYGLGAAFWIPGLVGGLFLLLLVRIFYEEPSDVGMRPLGDAGDGEPVRRVKNKGEIARLRTSAFMKQAQRTFAFWNLIGIHFWGCAGHAIIVVYLVALAEERGVSPGLAAGSFVALTVTSSLSRFLVPIIADNFGSKAVMAICFTLQVLPLGLLFFAYDAWMFYLFAILFGIGFGGEMTAFPIINRQYYGNAPVGATYGWQMAGAGIGMATGSALGGLLKDLTGDFNATLALSFGLSMAGVVAILILPSTRRRQIPDWEDALPPEARTTPAAAHAHGD